MKNLVFGICLILVLSSSIQAQPPLSTELPALDSITAGICDRAGALMDIGEDEAAIRYLMEQVLEHPTNYYLKAYLGITYKSQGQIRKAMKSLERLSRTHVNDRLDSSMLTLVRYQFSDLVTDSVQTLKLKALRELSDESRENALILANMMIETARRDYFFVDYDLNFLRDNTFLYSYRLSAISSFNDGIALRAFVKWLDEPVENLVLLDLETDPLEVELTYLNGVEDPYCKLVHLVYDFVEENGLNESCSDKLKYYELIRQCGLLCIRGWYYEPNSLNNNDTTSLSTLIDLALLRLPDVYWELMLCHNLPADVEKLRFLILQFEDKYPKMVVMLETLYNYRELRELILQNSSSSK